MRDQEIHSQTPILEPGLETQFVELQKILHLAIATQDEKAAVYREFSGKLKELSSELTRERYPEANDYVSIVDQCLSCLNTDIETAGISLSRVTKQEEVLAKAVDQLITHVIQLHTVGSTRTDVPMLASSLSIASNELRSIFGFDLKFDEISGVRFNADGSGVYQNRDQEGLSTYSLKNSASILHLIATLELISAQLELDDDADVENTEIEIAFGQQLAAAVDNRMLRDAWLLASETYRLLVHREITPVSPPFCSLLGFLKTLCSVDCDNFELQVQRKLSELVYLLAVHGHYTRMECVFSHYGILTENRLAPAWRNYVNSNLLLTAPDYYAMASLVTCLKESIANAKDSMHSLVESGEKISSANPSVLQVLDQVKKINNALEFLPFLTREPELKRNIEAVKRALHDSQVGVDDQTFEKIAELIVSLEDVLGNQVNAISTQGSQKALAVQLNALLSQLQSIAERCSATENRPASNGETTFNAARQCLTQLLGSAKFLGDIDLEGAIDRLAACFNAQIQRLEAPTSTANQPKSEFDRIGRVCELLLAATDDIARDRGLSSNDSLSLACNELDTITNSIREPRDALTSADEFGEQEINNDRVETDTEPQGLPTVDVGQPLSADIDDEIAEIFLEEAREILEILEQSQSKWIETIAADGFNSEHFLAQLSEVRRHFHTLKGSGRMAVAEHIGELAWAIENMLNRALDKTITYGRAQDVLVWRAIEMLPALLISFEQRLTPTLATAPLIAEAEVAADQTGPEGDAESIADDRSAGSPMQPDRSTYVMNVEAEIESASGESVDATEGQEHLNHYESEFQKECEEIFAKLGAAIDELRRDGQSRSAFSLASLQVHTILGSAPLASFEVLGKVARVANEQLMELANLNELPPYAAEALAQYHQLFVESLPSAQQPLLSAETALQRAFEIRDQWKTEQHDNAERPGLQQAVQQSDLLFEISTVLEDWRTSPVKGVQFEKLIGEIDSLLKADKVPAPVEALLIALKRVYTNICGRALSFSSFHLLRQSHEDLENQLSSTLIDQEPSYSAAVARLDAFSSQLMRDDCAAESPANTEPTSDDSFSAVDVDEEILAMFREELADLLDELRSCFARWQEGNQQRKHLAPFLRPLHTIKGSARMASIDAIASMAHDLETLIESGEAKSDTTSIDSGVFSQQYTQLEKKCTAFLSGAVITPVVSEKKAQIVERRARDRGAQSSSKEMVRVPASVVDRLNNLADENTISRSVIAQRVTDFSDSFEEIDSTLNRLREQLRQLDIETEAQIGSRSRRLDDQDKEGFDPLEMDRYSKLQQLTRALAESASDLKDLYGTQKDSIRNVETMLVQQSRITREMQQSLQQTRTVSLSRVLIPRMRKTLAGLSEELQKPVALSVLNVDGQLDKRILERLVGPIEHILRNAIDHGLESQGERKELGKKPEGLICVDITRLGGELQIEIKDDGKGINIDAVKAKAIKQKLIDGSSMADDHQLMQLIFQPGFSTAEKLTQISGRGVGLDVVANELKQLGGSVSVSSAPGSGTTFTLRIPFNVSMNRALLIGCHGETFAIPLDSLQGIVRVSSFELEEQYQNPELVFEYAGQEYEFRYLGGALSGHKPQYSLDQYASVPVLLCKAADKLVAYQIDSLLGSREIVLKTLGPKFKPIPGIAGATILGDGSVVTILDLPELFRRGESTVQRVLPEINKDNKASADQCKALVVDDSVTVRKVTSRLLERLDIDVTTAKDGMDAIEVMESLRPDFVLLDVEMPHLDGFEVLSRMRRDSALRDVPVIMISSRSGEKHRQRARDLGADAFLGKPYQDIQLCSTLAEHCEKFAAVYNAQPDEPGLLEAS